MKLLLKIVAGFFTIILLGVGAVFYFSSGLTEEAEAFFAKARDGEFQTAYEMLSSEFQNSTTTEELEDFLKQTSLHEVAEHSWRQRNVSLDQGKLSGAVTTTKGSTFPVEMTFVKENGKWKILNLHKTSGGVSQRPDSSLAQLKLPPEEEQVVLVQKALYAFGESINAKSMANFHSHISQLWQRQHTVEKLDEAYKGIYGIEGDLTKISKLSPIFDAPASVDRDGVMKIAGHFPTQPQLLKFEQTFIREGTGWKLLGFAINFTGTG